MRVEGPVVRRVGALVAIGVLVITVAACKPIPMGSAGAQIGNDPANCAQFQPTPQAPCGPQPMVWASVQGPYERFENGDPYATKCGRNLTASASACSSGSYAGGATNELYDPTGYEYAVEVGADDVGVPLALEVYDAGSYPRRKGTTATTTATVTGSTTLSSTALRRSSGSFATSDIGAAVSGTGIPAGTTIVAFVSSTEVTMSQPATAGGSKTVTLTYSTDCNQALAPFNTSPYATGSWSAQHCQTGDSGAAPVQFQLFEDDSDDLKVTYDLPIAGCELYVGPSAQPWLYENGWAPVCTFVPARAGIYPLRVKSSAIVRPDGTAIADQGAGWNNFALRVGGGADTRLYAIDALPIWTNTPSSDASFYLAEVTSAQAGKRMQIDLFDPGDGSSGQYTIQVLAPPSGAPGLVPTGGTPIPAAGIADSCRYNPAASPTKGPVVDEPNGSASATCAITTKVVSSSSGIYNNGWLRIQIDLAADYACDVDCWWTVRYDFGSGSTALPTDRTTWSVAIVDRPAPPPTTTTTTESTTTTTESTTTTTTAPA